MQVNAFSFDKGDVEKTKVAVWSADCLACVSLFVSLFILFQPFFLFVFFFFFFLLQCFLSLNATSVSWSRVFCLTDWEWAFTSVSTELCVFVFLTLTVHSCPTTTNPPHPCLSSSAGAVPLIHVGHVDVFVWLTGVCKGRS